MKWQIPDGDIVRVFDDSRLTGTEIRLQKRITMEDDRPGLNPVQADDARKGHDQSAWTAALVIARIRDGVNPVEAMHVDENQFSPYDVFDATTKWLGSIVDELNSADDEKADAEEAPPVNRAARRTRKPAVAK